MRVGLCFHLWWILGLVLASQTWCDSGPDGGISLKMCPWKQGDKGHTCLCAPRRGSLLFTEHRDVSVLRCSVLEEILGPLTHTHTLPQPALTRRHEPCVLIAWCGMIPTSTAALFLLRAHAVINVPSPAWNIRAHLKRSCTFPLRLRVLAPSRASGKKRLTCPTGSSRACESTAVGVQVSNSSRAAVGSGPSSVDGAVRLGHGGSCVGH